MRGRKETLGSIKEGTKSKSRTSSLAAVKASTKMSGRTAGHAASGHGGISASSRKATTGKGGVHK
ncbi:MAG TPA: hypothetical protein VK187_15305 [Geobacteraceae bacterium]|nr:hypothetical protein [Geobacteraceae bacterium]